MAEAARRYRGGIAAERRLIGLKLANEDFVLAHATGAGAANFVDSGREIGCELSFPPTIGPAAGS